MEEANKSTGTGACWIAPFHTGRQASANYLPLPSRMRFILSQSQIDLHPDLSELFSLSLALIYQVDAFHQHF
jgi:hypothetical protein